MGSAGGSKGGVGNTGKDEAQTDTIKTTRWSDNKLTSMNWENILQLDKAGIRENINGSAKETTSVDKE